MKKLKGFSEGQYEGCSIRDVNNKCCDVGDRAGRDTREENESRKLPNK